jgi:adenylate cyclase
VTIAIAPAIAQAEQQRAMRKPPGSLDAWAAYQRGLWHLGKANADDNAHAESFFQLAIRLDQNFAGGYYGLASAQHQGARLFHTRDLAEAQSTAEALARQAVALDPADAQAHALLAITLMLGGDHEGARAEAEQALAINPNLARAHGSLGATLIFSGRPREGLAALRTCIRLDPRDPELVIRWLQVAQAHYFAHEYEAAVEAATRAVRTFPDYPTAYRWLAPALGQLGRTEEAKAALAKAIAPLAFDLHVRNRVPWMRPEDHAHMLEGLRKAGWQG